MILFEYKYITFFEVINNIKTIYNYTNIEIAFLLLWISIILLLILYIIPFIKIYFDYKKIMKEKNNKKELLKKIKLQKDIEDRIAKELNIW